MGNYSDYKDSPKPVARAESVPSGFPPTKPDIVGPFYLPGAPDRENISEGLSPVLILSGKVVDTDGQPLSGVTLDFWQADPGGKYDEHGFRHRGKVTTGYGGAYRLVTVRPGDYDISEPGDPEPHEFRCAHIHAKVWIGGEEVLTTQLYFPFDPYNATDRWFDAGRVVSGTGGSGFFDFVLRAGGG